MRFALCLLAALTGIAVTGCGTSDTISPANLRVEVRSSRAIYAPGETFSGTFRFVNKSVKNIRTRFWGSTQWRVMFFSSTGDTALTYDRGDYNVVTYLELGPLGTRTDKLEFPMSRYARPGGSLSPGTYRIHACVEEHDDIFSDATIEVR